MTKTTRGYTLRKTLREIVDEGGLPEKISTEAQLWDEIFKKLTYIAPELLLPLIREVHGKSYPVGVKIVPLSTEYSVQRTDTKEIAVIRADVTIIIDDKDIYHFESEISYDGLMAIRMMHGFRNSLCVQYIFRMVQSVPMVCQQSKSNHFL